MNNNGIPMIRGLTNVCKAIDGHDIDIKLDLSSYRKFVEQVLAPLNFETMHQMILFRETFISAGDQTKILENQTEILKMFAASADLVDDLMKEGPLLDEAYKLAEINFDNRIKFSVLMGKARRMTELIIESAQTFDPWLRSDLGS